MTTTLLPWSSIFYRMIGGRYWGLWVSTFTFWRGYQNRTWKVLPKWRQASVEQTCKHFYIVRNFEESKVRKFYLGGGYWLLNLSSVTIILEITLYPKWYIFFIKWPICMFWLVFEFETCAVKHSTFVESILAIHWFWQTFLWVKSTATWYKSLKIKTNFKILFLL